MKTLVKHKGYGDQVNTFALRISPTKDIRTGINGDGERITFDLNLRTYNSDTNFFELKNKPTPIFFDKINILEIKFSSPLPDHLKYLLSKIVAKRCAISKYVLGQKYINFSPWQDKISEPF